MVKLIVILLIALVFEAVGVVFLTRGLKQLGGVTTVSLPEITRIVGRGATNANVLLGVFFEATFFGALLVLLARSEVSFIWPLTSLGFVLTTLAAKMFLHEHVSGLRWSGVILIVAGAALISWSEQAREKTAPGAAPAQTVPAAPDR